MVLSVELLITVCIEVAELTEGTDDIPQEHFKHLMNIFYRTKVAITEEKAK